VHCRSSTVSAAPLFFGVVDAGLYGLLKDALLKLSPAFDDSLLTDSSIGHCLGKMRHLLEVSCVIEEKRCEVRVDLEADCLP
jgi:hypothetical protein